ncbi:phosphatidylinositol-glycan biosynthesis class W protein-like [Gossypium australe]|uniref:Phosphatidylinositol-glycan biosynthesis class W protein-like n=1 Tax=Gossypium australe TaxID=47621 RepID=A0A5B6VVP4_9ROSI|nr:phosphatidylinositol-glycan biosynthesis class W protein-like [Gossypium australe]
MNTRLSLSEDGSITAELRAELTFLQQICEAQKSDSELHAKRNFRLGLMIACYLEVEYVYQKIHNLYRRFCSKLTMVLCACIRGVAKCMMI